ncbi:hypothetical protein HID58_055656 [Brassica napus]|uniref:Zinc knuckle CX2CX4HX4C domain-containing protein n=1 Tax=Brassica napus TaxID=3708 RepID=A0ABQ8ALV3_BRANA|nr:hypothetical protein HID58_055656 [Brassica napus]
MLLGVRSPVSLPPFVLLLDLDSFPVVNLVVFYPKSPVSIPPWHFKGKGILYEEDDEPILLFDDDDAHTIREYRMSLIGKVLNPKKQNVEKLIQKPLVFKKKVQSPVGEEVTITIKYDLLFKHCTVCGLLTHEESYCSKKVEMMKAQTVKVGVFDRVQLPENNTVRQPIMDGSKDRMLSRPYHYGAASTAHRSDDYYSHRIDRELKYKSSFAHEGYNRDRRYDNRERNGRRSVDSHVMGKTNAARYGRRFAPYEHSATSQWREKQSRSGGLHTSDRSLEINGGASKSSAAQEHVRDQDVVVASRSENVRHSSGKKLASAIVTPSRIALDDTNVTVRGHEIVRSMTFSPTEKAMQQSPKGDDLVIDALKDMDIAGIGEKDQHAMTMDCDEDDLLGAELETMEDVECVQESS